jgi:hypothetical protein
MAKYSSETSNGSTTKTTSTKGVASSKSTRSSGTSRKRTRTRTSGASLSSATKTRSNKRGTRTINGETVKKSSSTYKVKNGITQLAKLGIALTESEEVSTDFSSEALLQSLGCSVVTGGKEKQKTYSLLESETDTETVANINILDAQKFSNLKNKGISLSDKFTNVDDPIFDLDDAPSLKIQQERNISLQKSAPDVVSIAADLVSLNLKASNNSVLKQFTGK